MGVINHVASAVSLAKSWRMSLDHASINTVIPTATLNLILNSLIEIGEGQSGAGPSASEAASKAVGQRMAVFQSAIKDRDT